MVSSIAQGVPRGEASPLVPLQLVAANGSGMQHVRRFHRSLTVSA